MIRLLALNHGGRAAESCIFSLSSHYDRLCYYAILQSRPYVVSRSWVKAQILTTRGLCQLAFASRLKLILHLSSKDQGASNEKGLLRLAQSWTHHFPQRVSPAETSVLHRQSFTMTSPDRISLVRNAKAKKQSHITVVNSPLKLISHLFSMFGGSSRAKLDQLGSSQGLPSVDYGLLSHALVLSTLSLFQSLLNGVALYLWKFPQF
jgi:hypothetical protein